MGCVTIAEDTTIAEEESLARHYPWQCWSNSMRQFEEFPTLESMARAKGLSVGIIMDAIASDGGNFEGLHFVKR